MKLKVLGNRSNIRGISIGENTILRNSSESVFLRQIQRAISFNAKEISVEKKDSDILTSYCFAYGMTLPNLKVIGEERKEAETEEIIMGAGSNNIELATTHVKIESTSIFNPSERINRRYFNCVDLNDGSKFTYYLDIKSGKRYFKKDATPNSFIRLNELASLEEEIMKKGA